MYHNQWWKDRSVKVDHLAVKSTAKDTKNDIWPENKLSSKIGTWVYSFIASDFTEVL